MPIFLGAHVLIALACAVHALRTGREMYWLFILFMFPGLGSAAYVVVEVLPSLGQGRHARAAGAAAKKAIDPNREVRDAMRQLNVSRTPGNLKRAGEALVAVGKPDEAVELFREATSGAFGDDSALLASRARAEFEAGDPHAALESLEALRKAEPNANMPHAHLTYARSLEAVGRKQEALDEYEALAGYFPGGEARARWAMLLERENRQDEADERWGEILDAAEIAPKFARRNQREWIQLARSRAR